MHEKVTVIERHECEQTKAAVTVKKKKQSKSTKRCGD